MMKFKIFIFVTFVLFLNISNVYAFRGFGDVLEGLRFDDLEVRGNRICGELKNQSRDHLYIFTDILLTDRYNLLDKATLHAKIQPKSNYNFCSYLDRSNPDADDAINAEWDVYMLERNGKQEFFRDSKY